MFAAAIAARSPSPILSVAIAANVASSARSVAAGGSSGEELSRGNGGVEPRDLGRVVLRHLVANAVDDDEAVGRVARQEVSAVNLQEVDQHRRFDDGVRAAVRGHESSSLR